MTNIYNQELASLTMPVQLILGGQDAMIRSQETRERMERHVPHLHLRYLEDEGHILPRQTSAIAEFMRREQGSKVQRFVELLNP